MHQITHINLDKWPWNAHLRSPKMLLHALFVTFFLLPSTWEKLLLSGKNISALVLEIFRVYTQIEGPFGPQWDELILQYSTCPHKLSEVNDFTCASFWIQNYACFLWICVNWPVGQAKCCKYSCSTWTQLQFMQCKWWTISRVFIS